MFLIAALPRSRTTWLAHYLSYPLARPRMYVGHDIMTGCDSVEMFINSYRNGMWGTVETGGAELIHVMQQEMPECKIVLIRRPLIEVYRSLMAKEFVADLTKLAEYDQMLDDFAADPRIVSVPYDLLSEQFIGKWLFEYLLEIEFDFEWWMSLIQTNIQIDMKEVMQYMHDYSKNLTKLSEDVKRWMKETRRIN